MRNAPPPFEFPSCNSNTYLFASNSLRSEVRVRNCTGRNTRLSLSPSQKQILRHIAASEDNKGISISKRELAEQLGYSFATIENGLRVLRVKGLVRAKAEHNDDGGQVANLYRLTAICRRNLTTLLGGRARQSATVGLVPDRLPPAGRPASPHTGAVKASRLAGRTRRRTAGSRSNRRRLLKENRILLSDSSGQLIRIGDLTSRVREPRHGANELPVA